MDFGRVAICQSLSCQLREGAGILDVHERALAGVFAHDFGQAP